MAKPSKPSDPMKRVTLDIETSPIKGKVWGIRNQFLSLDQIDEPTRMLSIAAKWYGQSKTWFWSDWTSGGHEAMVQAAWNLVNEAEVIIHYNGKSFDMRHLNREFKEQGLGEPSQYQYIDLYQKVKQKFALPSYKLEYVLRWLGAPGKIQHSGFKMWNQVMDGDEKARRLFRRYNIGDVVKTEWVYDELRGWIDGHPNMQLFVPRGDRPGCPVCGSTNVNLDGTAPRGNLSRVQKYQCKDCDKFFRGKLAVDQAEER